jgi:putative lipoprotein (rSAM/lipoprotein system)
MYNKFSERKRKFLRGIYGTLSLSTALFVFQACYGTSHDMVRDILVHGTVTSKVNNQPIPGIKVSIDNDYLSVLTDTSGKFEMYAMRASEYKLLFQDVDSITNGNFKEKDTVLKISNVSYFLNIRLDAK